MVLFYHDELATVVIGMCPLIRANFDLIFKLWVGVSMGRFFCLSFSISVSLSVEKLKLQISTYCLNESNKVSSKGP